MRQSSDNLAERVGSLRYDIVKEIAAEDVRKKALLILESMQPESRLITCLRDIDTFFFPIVAKEFYGNGQTKDINLLEYLTFFLANSFYTAKRIKQTENRDLVHYMVDEISGKMRLPPERYYEVNGSLCLFNASIASLYHVFGSKGLLNREYFRQMGRRNYLNAANLANSEEMNSVFMNLSANFLEFEKGMINIADEYIHPALSIRLKQYVEFNEFRKHNGMISKKYDKPFSAIPRKNPDSDSLLWILPEN
jgi:hypothetical protein